MKPLKLVEMLPIQQGVGQNGEWKSQEFVVETYERFPKKLCFQANGIHCDKLSGLAIGQFIFVSYDIECRKHNDRYFTSLIAWDIVPAEHPINYYQNGGQNKY